MNFLGLRTLVFQVPDLEKARDWYAQILGFPPYFDEPFYVGFNVAGYELGLQPLDGAAQKTGENACTYFGVENVETEFERLLGLGATVHEMPTEVGGGIVVAAVKDPWGNLFGLIFNPHFTLAPKKGVLEK